VDPRRFYDRADEVDRYLRLTNPLRTMVYYPRYGALPERFVDFARHRGGAASLLVSSAREFYRRAKLRLQERLH
jgi:hypothetical protein